MCTLIFYKLTLIYTHVSTLEESVTFLLQAAEGCERGMPRCLPIKEARGNRKPGQSWPA
jgi:hypothetical protein